MNDETPLDLSALDPERDPSRLERSARAIAARVEPSLRRRRERAPLLWLELSAWRRPVLAAAALVAVASVAALTIPRPAVVRTSSAPGRTIAEAAGVAPALAAWAESGTPLSNATLLGVEDSR